jgi:hypothetical protein
MFGPNLDIVYPRENQTVESIGYQHVMYWNDTRLIPDSLPIPPQSAAGNESAWQLHTPTPQNTSIPSDLNSFNIYAVGISVLAVVVVFAAILKFRKEPSNSHPTKKYRLQ